MKNDSNMYKLSRKQWSPFVGCEHECSYCKPSFQAQLKRWAGVVKDGKRRCEECYQFKPHFHPERLDQKMPRTGFMQFIFTCSNGDVAFCPTFELHRIVHTIKRWKDRTFLIQSKNPSTFSRIKFPRNVILGTTIETNRERIWERSLASGGVVRYLQISKAPHPTSRILSFQAINHPLKMLIYEPILDFDVDVMVHFADLIKPCMIWLGYDSKNTKMPEPTLQKVKQLHWELSKLGFIVILKTIRKAWYEK